MVFALGREQSFFVSRALSKRPYTQNTWFDSKTIRPLWIVSRADGTLLSREQNTAVSSLGRAQSFSARHLARSPHATSGSSRTHWSRTPIAPHGDTRAPSTPTCAIFRSRPSPGRQQIVSVYARPLEETLHANKLGSTPSWPTPRAGCRADGNRLISDHINCGFFTRARAKFSARHLARSPHANSGSNETRLDSKPK